MGRKAKQQHCVWNPQRLSDIHVYLFALTNVSMNTHKIPTAEYRNGSVWCGATASDFNAVWGSTFVWMGLTAMNWSSVLTVKSCPVLLSRKQTTKRETRRASYLCAWIFFLWTLAKVDFFLLWNLNCLSKQGFLPLYVCVCFICSFMPPTVQWFSMKKNGTKGFPHNAGFKTALGASALVRKRVTFKHEDQ